MWFIHCPTKIAGAPYVLIMLITMYNKSKQDDISKEVLLEVIAEVVEEENEE